MLQKTQIVQVLYGLERVELRSTSIFDDCPVKSREGRQEGEGICPRVSLKRQNIYLRPGDLTPTVSSHEETKNPISNV